MAFRDRDLSLRLSGRNARRMVEWPGYLRVAWSAGQGGLFSDRLAGTAAVPRCLRAPRNGGRNAFGRDDPVGSDGWWTNPSGSVQRIVRSDKPVETPSGLRSWPCLDWRGRKLLPLAFGPAAMNGRAQVVKRMRGVSLRGDVPRRFGRWSSRSLSMGLRAAAFGRRSGKTAFGCLVSVNQEPPG